MTAYNGSLTVPLMSDRRAGRRQGNERKEVKNIMSTEKAHGGTYSLRILGGGYHDVFYGCDAGSKTISVWVYPPAVGKCAIQVFDGPVVIIGEDFNGGSAAWEQLSVMFTALKKVYVVRLINFALAGDTRAYFDDLT